MLGHFHFLRSACEKGVRHQECEAPEGPLAAIGA